MYRRILRNIITRNEQDVYLIGSLTGSTVGAIGGFLYGMRTSRQYDQGFVYRPVGFGACGMTVGFLLGCYWPYTLASVCLAEFAHDHVLPTRW